ncbi:MAG: hypothetical protein Q9195_003226 [Heterodermia aff. obscurata]
MLASSLALLALVGGVAADRLQPRWGYGWNTTAYPTGTVGTGTGTIGTGVGTIGTGTQTKTTYTTLTTCPVTSTHISHRASYHPSNSSNSYRVDDKILQREEGRSIYDEIHETDSRQSTKTTETVGTTTVPVYTTLTVGLIFVLDNNNNDMPGDLDDLYNRILNSHSPYYRNFDDDFHLHNCRPCYGTNLHDIDANHRNDDVPRDFDNLYECILDSHSSYYKNSDNKHYLHNRSPCYCTNLHNLDDSESALEGPAGRGSDIFLDHRNNDLPCDVDNLHERVFHNNSPSHHNSDDELCLHNRSTGHDEHFDSFSSYPSYPYALPNADGPDHYSPNHSASDPSYSIQRFAGLFLADCLAALHVADRVPRRGSEI